MNTVSCYFLTQMTLLLDFKLESVIHSWLRLLIYQESIKNPLSEFRMEVSTLKQTFHSLKAVFFFSKTQTLLL